MNYIQPTKFQAWLCLALAGIGLGLARLACERELPGVPNDAPDFSRETVAAMLAVVSLIPFGFAVKLKFGRLRRSIGLHEGHLIQADSASPKHSFSVPVSEIRRIVVEQSHDANDTVRVETDVASRELLFIPAPVRNELIGELRRLNPGIEFRKS